MAVCRQTPRTNHHHLPPFNSPRPVSVRLHQARCADSRGEAGRARREQMSGQDCNPAVCLHRPRYHLPLRSAWRVAGLCQLGSERAARRIQSSRVVRRWGGGGDSGGGATGGIRSQHETGKQFRRTRLHDTAQRAAHWAGWGGWWVRTAGGCRAGTSDGDGSPTGAGTGAGGSADEVLSRGARTAALCDLGVPAHKQRTGCTKATIEEMA